MKFTIKFGKGFAKVQHLPERVLGGLKAGVARMARRLMLQSMLPTDKRGLPIKPYAKVQGRHILARTKIMRGRLARLGLGRMPMPKVRGLSADGWEGQRLRDGRQVIGRRDEAGNFKPLYLRRRRVDWAGPAAATRAAERKRILVTAITERLRK